MDESDPRISSVFNDQMIDEDKSVSKTKYL